MKPYLSVVIPSYNEEENIKSGVLEEIYKYLSKQKYTWEVLVSDDGSTDNSRSVAKDRVVKLKGFRVLENPHGGKPSTLRYGVAASGGKYILFTDMDQSTPINQLAKLMPFTK